MNANLECSTAMNANLERRNVNELIVHLEACY
jgi:hypothetical protein